MEEIERLIEAGMHVSIVRRTDRPVPPGPGPAEEKLRLERWLEDQKKRALVREYSNETELRDDLQSALAAQADRFVRPAEDTSERDEPGAASDPTIGVWPTVEVTEHPTTDSKGRLKTKRNWYLVLRNATGRPVHNVSYRYENEDGEAEERFDFLSPRNDPIPIMAPDAVQRFPLGLSMSSVPQTTCAVSWEADGTTHETKATVRKM